MFLKALWGLSWESAPKELELWWETGQNIAKVPEIENSSTFSKALGKYWVKLQPDWRGNSLSRNAPQDHSWAQYAVPGPNGLFLIIICLSWWLPILEDQDREKFFALTEDVAWVLVQSTGKLLSATSTTGRRARKSQPDPDFGKGKASIKPGKPSATKKSTKKRASTTDSTSSRKRPRV
jgi:hypothetical protein